MSLCKHQMKKVVRLMFLFPLIDWQRQIDWEHKGILVKAKVRAVVFCGECHKPRCIYSKSKLSLQEKAVVDCERNQHLHLWKPLVPGWNSTGKHCLSKRSTYVYISNWDAILQCNIDTFSSTVLLLRLGWRSPCWQWWSERASDFLYCCFALLKTGSYGNSFWSVPTAGQI